MPEYIVRRHTLERKLVRNRTQSSENKMCRTMRVVKSIKSCSGDFSGGLSGSSSEQCGSCAMQHQRLRTLGPQAAAAAAKMATGEHCESLHAVLLLLLLLMLLLLLLLLLCVVCCAAAPTVKFQNHCVAG